MKITVIVEIEAGGTGRRTVMEQIVTDEDYRGDYRMAVGECASRVELSTFGPQQQKEGYNFDEQLKLRPPQ